VSPGAHISTLKLFALLACALAPSVSAGAQPEPPSGWFGNVYLGGARSFDARKVFVVSYRVTDGAAQLVDASVAYGAESRLPPASNDYALEVLDANGRVLARQQAADPRRIVVEQEGNRTLPSAVLAVRLRFDAAGAKARLHDSTGRVVAESDVAPAVALFCRNNDHDPECR